MSCVLRPLHSVVEGGYAVIFTADKISLLMVAVTVRKVVVLLRMNVTHALWQVH